MTDIPDIPEEFVEAYGAMVAHTGQKNTDFDLSAKEKEFLDFVKLRQKRLKKDDCADPERTMEDAMTVFTLEVLAMGLLYKKLYSLFGDRIEPDSDLAVAMMKFDYTKPLTEEVIDDILYQYKYTT